MYKKETVVLDEVTSAFFVTHKDEARWGWFSDWWTHCKAKVEQLG